jgi:septation ring formation regulator EzrA
VKLDEVPPVLDVHPPHESMHGWRDFLLHLFTITIGLLIALGLEGCVEWQHHRHLVHEAEASLHAEIESNAKGLPDALAALHKNQDQLKHDIEVLKYIIQNHKDPEHSSMSIGSGLQTFDDVSWRTAQSTTALSYMPYARAEEYADIYTTQAELFDAEKQAARDAIISLAPFMNVGEKDSLPDDQARDIKQKIEVLQGQLTLVDAFMNSLDRSYKKFLAAHPD